MKLRECKEDVEQITDISQLTDRYGDRWAIRYQEEIKELIEVMNDGDIEIYLAPDFYFTRTTRGLYYTDVNRLFLNDRYVQEAYAFIDVFRHEGWHAAQDCMAGTIDNTFIAVIYDDDQVPQKYKLDADIRYGFLMAKAVPWEQEAIWAGKTPGMTVNALRACADNTPMWETYEPTPMTREWLQDNDYIR